ncbi:hypothetical protein D039_2216B, partial [Vibrio parahaemolyticus EKP-028]
IKLI